MSAEVVGTDTRRWLVLSVLCVIRLVIMLDTTALNVAVPALTTGLSSSTTQTQWVLASYSLALAGLLLTAGAIADRFGRKRALLVGLVLFTGGSAAGAFAATAGQLIVARAVMGVGAALLMPATFAVLMAAFGERERAKAIAVAWGATGAAMAAGPVFGGFLLTHFWWGAVLLVNVPIGILATAAVCLLVRESRDREARRLDPVGAVLSVLAAGTAVFSIISSGEHDWISLPVLAPAIVALAAVCGFVWWERRHTASMVDLRLFRDRRMTAATVEAVLSQFGLSGSVFLFTMYLQFVLGLGPFEAGVRLVPTAIVVLLCVPVVPRLMTRFGAPAALLCGLLMLGAGILALSRLGPVEQYPQTLLGLVLAGAGIALAMPASAEVLMQAVPADRAATAGGLTSMMQELGNALGVAVLGSLLVTHLTTRLSGVLPPGSDRSMDTALQASMHDARADELLPLVKTAFVEGMAVAMQVGALVVALAGVGCWLLIRGRKRPDGGHRRAMANEGD